MTIMSSPWPADPIDQHQLTKLLDLAQTLKPSWKPPETHERDTLGRFKNSTASMRTHIRELVASLPPGTLLALHAGHLTAGMEYVNSVRFILRELLAKHPNDYAGIEPLLEQMAQAGELLRDVRNKLVTRGVDMCPREKEPDA